jgi:hypothetical protein
MYRSWFPLDIYKTNKEIKWFNYGSMGMETLNI